MNKTFLSLIAGLVIGGGAVWWTMHPHGDAKPGAAAAPEAKAEEEPTPGKAKLTPEQQASSGLATVTPQAAKLPREARAYGRVLDLSPLIVAVADVTTTQAALTASEKDFNRLRTLHAEGENASAQSVETADAVVQRDRVALLAARARLAAGWGNAVAAKIDFKLLEETLKSGWSLVRIDATAGLNAAPTAARVGALTDDSLLTEVELLGPAPSTDAQLQGAGWLALWREHALPPGAMVRATLTLAGDPEEVLLLPRVAIVRHEGSAWIYVQTETGSYERHRVEIARPLADGYAIASGVKTDDKVVSVGAQQLLSTELNASAGEPD